MVTRVMRVRARAVDDTAMVDGRAAVVVHLLPREPERPRAARATHDPPCRECERRPAVRRRARWQCPDCRATYSPTALTTVCLEAERSAGQLQRGIPRCNRPAASYGGFGRRCEPRCAAGGGGTTVTGAGGEHADRGGASVTPTTLSTGGKRGVGEQLEMPFDAPPATGSGAVAAPGRPAFGPSGASRPTGASSDAGVRQGDGEPVGGGADLGSEAGIGFRVSATLARKRAWPKARRGSRCAGIRADGTRVCSSPTTAGGTEASQRVEGWTNSG